MSWLHFYIITLHFQKKLHNAYYYVHYNAKGNMVTDNWKGITNITYDLPTLKFMLNSFSEGVLR